MRGRKRRNSTSSMKVHASYEAHGMFKAGRPRAPQCEAALREDPFRRLRRELLGVVTEASQAGSTHASAHRGRAQRQVKRGWLPERPQWQTHRLERW